MLKFCSLVGDDSGCPSKWTAKFDSCSSLWKMFSILRGNVGRGLAGWAGAFCFFDSSMDVS